MPVLAWLLQEVIHEYPSYPNQPSYSERVDTQVVAAVLDQESGTLTSVGDMARASKTNFVRVRPASGHRDPKTGQLVKHVTGRIQEADIAAVRERIRVDEVIGDYVSLRRAGDGALKGPCPFRDEKTPSFNVRPSHGTFHCSGCGEGGDVITFVMKIEHLGFDEAVERLADRAGIELHREAVDR
jgi:hypothetical protein